MAEKVIRFTFLVNQSERRLIAEIAERLCRTQADALRLLVRAAAEELDVSPEKSDREYDQPQGV